MATANEVGLFLAAWEFGNPIPGAPAFRLSGTVDTVRKVFRGVCRMSQATLPPPDFASDVHGSYKEAPERFLLEAKGTHDEVLPPPKIGTVVQTNLELRIAFDGRWDAGRAHVRYLLNGHWNELADLPVHRVRQADLALA